MIVHNQIALRFVPPRREVTKDQNFVMNAESWHIIWRLILQNRLQIIQHAHDILPRQITVNVHVSFGEFHMLQQKPF